MCVCVCVCVCFGGWSVCSSVAVGQSWHSLAYLSLVPSFLQLPDHSACCFILLAPDKRLLHTHLFSSQSAFSVFLWQRGEGCKADIQPFSGATLETKDSESLRHTSRPLLLYSSGVLLSIREQGFYLPRLHREETQMSQPYFSSLPGTMILLTCLRTRWVESGAAPLLTSLWLPFSLLMILSPPSLWNLPNTQAG